MTAIDVWAVLWAVSGMLLAACLLSMIRHPVERMREQELEAAEKAEAERERVVEEAVARISAIFDAHQPGDGRRK